ncbi:MAG: hypothetical protein WAT79_13090 [Saprospiraceae bacterium]
MKNHIQNVFTGFLAAIFTIVCFLVFSFFTEKKEVSPNSVVPISSAISWNEAVALKNKFKTLQPLMMEVSGNSGSEQIPLEGFKIQASQLLEIINNNKSGGGNPADFVMFYLGAQDPTSGMTLPSYHMIAVGMQGDNLLIPTSESDKKDASKSSIFDKADPCPPFCPN